MPRTQERRPALTIEELARRVGLSTRNVRAYRTAGLLPPPTLEGRTGRYGDEHLRRFGLIWRPQRRGGGAPPAPPRPAPPPGGPRPPRGGRVSRPPPRARGGRG